MINGRRSTDKLVSRLTQAYKFAEPVSDLDVPLRLAAGVADQLLLVPEKVLTEELIVAAKHRCPPLRGSINSRAFALAILASILFFAVLGTAQTACTSSALGASCSDGKTVVSTTCHLLGCTTEEYQLDEHGRRTDRNLTRVGACREAIHDFKDGSGSQKEVNRTCAGLPSRYSKWVKESK